MKNMCFLWCHFFRSGNRWKISYYHKNWHGNRFLKIFFIHKKHFWLASRFKMGYHKNTDKRFFKVAPWWKYWWLMKSHFTTIMLPYYHMVIKVPFYSWNKCSIFFCFTSYGTKKPCLTIIMVIKIFKKILKWKIIPFLVRGPFYYQSYLLIFYFIFFHKKIYQ